MTGPTIAQLRNLADRAATGLTPGEQQRLRDGIDQLARATDGELRRQLAAAIQALGKSETELADVRALRDRWLKAGAPPLGTSINRWWDKRLVELNAALDQPGPTTSGHVYLSTGCYHGDHAYCQSMTGLNGAKRPAVCKFCQAACQCGCHSEAGQPGPAAAQATEPGSWLLAGTRDLPEPSDPTECTGEEGFCPEHGFHRHSLKEPGPA